MQGYPTINTFIVYKCKVIRSAYNFHIRLSRSTFNAQPVIWVIGQTKQEVKCGDCVHSAAEPACNYRQHFVGPENRRKCLFVIFWRATLITKTLSKLNECRRSDSKEKFCIRLRAMRLIGRAIRFYFSVRYSEVTALVI